MPSQTVPDIMAYGGLFLAPTRNPFNYEKIEQINRDLTTNWLTLDEITQQLNLFGDQSQDDYLSGLELAVRMHIEDYLGMPIFPVSFRTYYSTASLYGTPLCLDLPEVMYKDKFNSGSTVINSVTYWDGGTPNVLQVVNPTQYFYDATGNKVVINTLPNNSISTSRTAPLMCEFTLTPNFLQAFPVIKQAALLLLTHLYNNRSETTVNMLHNIPYGVDALLRPYKPLVM